MVPGGAFLYRIGHHNPESSQVAGKRRSGTNDEILEGRQSSAARRAIKDRGRWSLKSSFPEVGENRSSTRRCKSWVSSRLGVMAALVNLRSGVCHPGTQTGEVGVTAPVGSATSKLPESASRIERINSWVAAVLSAGEGKLEGSNSRNAAHI